MTKVKMPDWWTGTKKAVYGYTDKVNTVCCSMDICWFVDVPSLGYEGYFKTSDLKTIKGQEALCVKKR